MIRTVCGDLPCPTEAEIPQMLPYETEIYLSPSPFLQRPERPPLGGRKTVPVVLLALHPIHTSGMSLFLPPCIPSTNTALRTANTAPSTMRFWEAASRWRSQEDRIPTVGLSVREPQSGGSRRKSSERVGRATVSLAAWLQSESLTSIRLARIELWCLEQVEEDAASKPGPWLRILFATS